jgi:Protein of unknown function (DUF1592)/Protein of unknown function (DUF1588)/Protein of unknown function (DUF1595)/Protein of unknown function (DUF1585)/Protein of unknown function (DUF1587)
MPRFGRFPKLLAATALIGLGCTGEISTENRAGTGSGGPGVGPGPGSGGGSGSGGGAGPGAQAPGDLGRAVFRRFNRTEYNNTIRDLLGDTSRPATAFAADQDSARSGYFVGGAIANADASHLLEATEQLAANAMKRLPELLPCKSLPAAAPDQDRCAQQFIAQFGKRAFRRPLSQEEVAGFTDFYSGQRSAGVDFPNAMRLTLSAFLLSPQFLYRWEVTPQTAIREGSLVRYNPYEIASRLSYLIWASMPDEAAFALADQNKLATPDQIEAEARRLLQDPRAKDAVADFFTQWLEVSDLRTVPKDAKVYPTYTAELAQAMVAESATFAATNVIEGDGKLSTVFTSSRGFVDANLARLYGVSGVTGTALTGTDLDPTQRGGILTQASFLAQHASSDESNPTRRGKILTDRVICVDIPLPPDDVPDPKPPAPNLSVRERFDEHSKNPCATACHSVMDPLGFAFENYDGIGAYQTTDGGKPVDATGSIELDGQKKRFANAIELGKHLGASRQVAECMARQFLRYALRRKETPGDQPSLAAAAEAFGKESGNLRELIVALTKTRAFTHRTPSTGEVLP